MKAMSTYPENGWSEGKAKEFWWRCATRPGSFAETEKPFVLDVIHWTA